MSAFYNNSTVVRGNPTVWSSDNGSETCISVTLENVFSNDTDSAEYIF